MADDERTQLVHTPREAFAALDLARIRAQGKLLTVDMDVWDGLQYGPEPEQTLDAWELYDLAPREGWPAVMFLHGGGWVTGHRDVFRVQAPLLARKGVLSASAGYRLAPAHRWPAQLDDVLAAIERLRGLQIDQERIGLWGVSAGGHLALLAAQELGPEVIKCVVTLGAPTDLLALRDGGYDELPLIFEDEQLREASPALSDKPLPPVLCLHGERDPVVPVDQARRLAAAHANVELRVVKKGDHMLRFPPQAGVKELKRARDWVKDRLADKPRGSKWKIRRKSRR